MTEATTIQKSKFSQLAYVFAASLVLGWAFDFLFFRHYPGLNFPVFTLVTLGSLFFFLHYYKIGYNRSVLWFLPVIGFFAAMVAVRSSAFLTFLNIVFTLGLILLMAYHAVGYRISQMQLWDYAKPFMVLPFKFLARALLGLGELLIVNKFVKGSDTSRRVIRGIVLALPILLFFAILFSAADQFFADFLAKLFNWNIEFETIFRTVLVLGVAGILFGTFLYLLENATPHLLPLHANEKPPGKFGSLESYIIFGSLNALFLLFIIFQIRYFFDRNYGIEELGYTYSEYARRGFFELVIVAVFSLLLIFAFEKYIERKQEHTATFKFLSLMLIVQVLAVLASAFMRLLQYEEAYGFTLLRFYVHAFMMWLVVVFCALAYKIWKVVRESVFTAAVLASAIAFLIAINIINPESFIARQNISRFHSTNRLDPLYLNGLTSDATPTLLEALPSLKGEEYAEVGQGLFFELEGQEYDLRVSLRGKWQSYQWSYNQGLKMLREHRQKLEEFRPGLGGQ